MFPSAVDIRRVQYIPERTLFGGSWSCLISSFLSGVLKIIVCLSFSFGHCIICPVMASDYSFGTCISKPFCELSLSCIRVPLQKLQCKCFYFEMNINNGSALRLQAQHSGWFIPIRIFQPITIQDSLCVIFEHRVDQCR